VRNIGVEDLGFRREVVVAADVAHRASTLAGQQVGAEATIKAGRDVVTSADVAVEELITGLLSDAFDHPVIGEERVGDRPADDRPHWLVDPICGTRNYASGVPLYCVNIALVAGDDVVGAAVADASTGEIVVAERGRGSWAIAGHRARRATASDQSHTIVVEDGKSADTQRDHAAAVAAAVIRADRWDFRSFGTTLSFPYLATGRIAAYLVFSDALAGSAPVHSAAGSLLVREAGGVLSDADGNPWGIGSPTLVAAATPVLHDELCRLVQAQRPCGGQRCT